MGAYVTHRRPLRTTWGGFRVHSSSGSVVGQCASTHTRVEGPRVCEGRMTTLYLHMSLESLVLD